MFLLIYCYSSIQIYDRRDIFMVHLLSKKDAMPNLNILETVKRLCVSRQKMAVLQQINFVMPKGR